MIFLALTILNSGVQLSMLCAVVGLVFEAHPERAARSSG